MKRRLLITLLSFVLIASLCAISSAASYTEVVVSTPEEFKAAMENDVGGTVVLGADITMSSTVTLGGLYSANVPTNIVLDLNGKTLRYDRPNGTSATFLSVNLPDTTLTICDHSASGDGMITCDDSGNVYLLHLQNGASVVIESGSVFAESPYASYLIMLKGATNNFPETSLIINGGTVGSNGAAWANTANGGTIYYNGGTIVTTADITSTSYNVEFSEGMKPQKDETGGYTLVPESEDIVFFYSVNGVRFINLQDAIDSIGYNGTITVLADATESSAVTIPDNISITLDLGTHELSMNGAATVTDSVIGTDYNKFTGAIINNGSLTITNGSIKTTSALIVNFGKLNIGQSASLEADYDVIDNIGGKLTSAGTLITNGPNNAIATYGGTVNVTGGHISATSSTRPEGSAIAIFNRGYNTDSEGATVTIGGGNIESYSYVASTNNIRSRGSNLTITGGNLKSYRTAIYWPASTTVTIGTQGSSYGPVITSTNGSAIEICAGTLNVHGGTLNGGTLQTSSEADKVPTEAWLVQAYRNSSGTANAGDAITVITQRASAYAELPIDVNIYGGTFNSTQNYGVRYMDCNTASSAAALGQNAEVNIYGGEFTGGIASVDAEFVEVEDQQFISGGEFSSSVGNYAAPNLSYELGSNNVYTYYDSLSAAQAAAKPGDTITFVGGDSAVETHTVKVVYDGNTTYTYKLADGTGFALPTLEKSGYTFTGWRVNNSNTIVKGGESYPITANTTFTAVWNMIMIPDTYDIAVDQPAHGTVDVSLSNASQGSVITVTATPDEGYELVYITVDGEPISGNSFVMPDHAVEVSALFAEIGKEVNFVDVSRADWFYDYVQYVAQNGLMEGTTRTAFEPNASMTRAMFWTVLARIDGETITGDAWKTLAQTWAVESGISDGTNADALITREQMVTMLYRYAGSPVAGGMAISEFTDGASVSGYATDAVTWALSEGILTGMGDGILAPQGTATRAQAAAMLMRFVEA